MVAKQNQKSMRKDVWSRPRGVFWLRILHGNNVSYSYTKITKSINLILSNNKSQLCRAYLPN